jgi:hypothetical protein
MRKMTAYAVERKALQRAWLAVLDGYDSAEMVDVPHALIMSTLRYLSGSVYVGDPAPITIERRCDFDQAEGAEDRVTPRLIFPTSGD